MSFADNHDVTHLIKIEDNLSLGYSLRISKGVRQISYRVGLFVEDVKDMIVTYLRENAPLQESFYDKYRVPRSPAPVVRNTTAPVASDGPVRRSTTDTDRLELVQSLRDISRRLSQIADRL